MGNNKKIVPPQGFVLDSVKAPKGFVLDAVPDVTRQDQGDRFGQPIQSAGRKIVEDVGAPWRTLVQAGEEIRGGEVVKGLLGGALGGIQTAMTPLTAITSSAQNFIPGGWGKAVANVINAPGVILGLPVQLLADLISKKIGTGDPETFRRATEIAKVLTMPAVGGRISALKNQIKNIPEVMLKTRAKTATKIGETVGAGENMALARRAGQYLAEEKIPVTKTGYTRGRHGLEIIPKGKQMALDRVSALNDALMENIIKPKTKAGELIDQKPVIDTYKGIRDEFANSLPPKRSAVALMDRLIKDTETMFERSDTPGLLTPEQAQALKVMNNEILNKYYRQASREGGLGPLQKLEERARADANTLLRQSLEKLDPQVNKINWTEGAGLDLAKAIDLFYQAKMRGDPSLIRGSGITGAAAGRPRIITLFAVTEMLAFKPFRIAWNRFLNRIATKVSGAESEFVRPGQITPAQIEPRQLPAK